ncbi:MAG: pyridoxamine 5'-phosphate oxidase family protein [Candidatus Cyclobacteriaceae bacterium M2_1C_046]
MTDIKNLTDKEAIKKIKEIVKDVKSCVFTTNLDSLPLEARPMHTKDVDDEGNLWFMLTKEGDHYTALQKDIRVQIFYSSQSKTEFLSYYGKAELIDDKEKKNKLWSAVDKTYFDGPEDKNLILAKIKPSDVYYWDTKHGRMVALFKMLSSAVTGNKKDIGVKGNLDV